MKKIIHKAGSRGYADNGWLKSFHTFSFAGYYDPDRINFGALRVLNDDTVAGGKGFGKHPHENMEIISIPLEGKLEHVDSMGNRHVIGLGDIQVMSAGTGIMHSEYNHSEDEPVKFLQIWVIPDKRDVPPRYAQGKADSTVKNGFLEIVSPRDKGEVWINQQAWFHLGFPEAGKSLDYRMHDESNGLYIFIIKGKVNVAGEELGIRDGMGVTEISDLQFRAVEDAMILTMEVPMQLNGKH